MQKVKKLSKVWIYILDLAFALPSPLEYKAKSIIWYNNPVCSSQRRNSKIKKKEKAIIEKRILKLLIERNLKIKYATNIANIATRPVVAKSDNPIITTTIEK